MQKKNLRGMGLVYIKYKTKKIGKKSLNVFPIVINYEIEILLQRKGVLI